MGVIDKKIPVLYNPVLISIPEGAIQFEGTSQYITFENETEILTFENAA